MQYDFDQLHNRRDTESIKWNYYRPDVLPLWVADMDFISPAPIISALRQRVDRGIFGYGNDRAGFKELIVTRMQERYRWTITTDDIVFVPGVVTAFNLACHAYARLGEGAFMQTPVYHPFLKAPHNAGLKLQSMQLTHEANGSYSIDYDLFERSLTPDTRIFILCSPHNPVGRVFRQEELERMAEICLHHNVIICSDEIHGDLVYSGVKHIPTASLAPEIAQNTVTLMAPSKTYNIAGLDCSFAIIQNASLRRRFQEAREGLVGGVNILGQVAGEAAYRGGQEWLDQLLAYLESNRDYLYEFVNHNLPGVQMWKPEGTYLAWLDCRLAGIPGKPCEFFEENARVGLNDGAMFGPGGEGFIRLNFGCPRSLLAVGLERMRAALGTLQ